MSTPAEETPAPPKRNPGGAPRPKVGGYFIATTLFVFIGCGAAVSSQSVIILHPDSNLDNTFLVAVALAFGIGISVLVYGIAPISGGHINPAVTLAFVLLRDLEVVLGLLYVAAQCVGAVLGAALVYGTFNSSIVKTLADTEAATPPFLLGVNSVAEGVPVGSGFLGEMMGTYLLVFTVLMTAAYKHNIASNLAPIAIGWSVFLAHVILIPITGCGINPARSFGPMIVDLMAGQKIGYLGWWIYYVAPFVGSALATVTCRYLFGVSSDGEGIFGEDPNQEIDMKDLRAAEPMMTANILTPLDKSIVVMEEGAKEETAKA